MEESNSKVLYIFSAFYPYSIVPDCFLEEETKYLVKEFSKVVIIPYFGDDVQREVPDGCEVWEPFFNRQNESRKTVKYLSKGIFCVKFIIPLIKDLFLKKPKLSLTTVRRIISYLLELNYLTKTPQYAKLLDNLKSNDVIYFYWGNGLNKLSIDLKKRVKIVSRFHGFGDLWEDSFDDYVPFRTQIVKSLDRCVFISHLGEKYFKNLYPYANTETHPLGSIDFGTTNTTNTHSNEINILSCSTVYPLKRVDLIFRSLNHYANGKIKWTHIGGGQTFDELKVLVEKERKEHLDVNLIGTLKHDSVMEYIKQHKFDIFINLSTVEGVPVSIMEAISFDIPIIATNVGATSEVVPEYVGILVSPNPTVEEICDAIDEMKTSKYTPRMFWDSCYNASKNYQRFAKMLANI